MGLSFKVDFVKKKKSTCGSHEQCTIPTKKTLDIGHGRTLDVLSKQSLNVIFLVVGIQIDQL